MITKFNKKGETVITLTADETIIMAHVLKQFAVNASYDQGCDRYFITDGIASCLKEEEYLSLRDMWSRADDAVREIFKR